MGLSLVSLVEFMVRRSFISAGLRRESFRIDSETTMSCWLSPSLLPSSGDTNPKRTTRKPVLLLIHGFGPHASLQWRCQVRPFKSHFDLVLPDLLFFGDSTTTSPARSEAFQAECVARLMDVLVGPGGAFSVGGTSYGGFVAYHVARACGAARVERVVLASSDVLKAEGDDRALAARGGVERVSDMLLPRTARELRTLLGLSMHRAPRIMPEFLLRDAVQSLFKDKREEKLELMKAITLGNKDEFQLTPLPQEVLVIWGEHDQIFPLEKAFELKKRLGEKARLEIIENTGHVPQAEDPKKFNQILLNFFNCS